jgi:hypothetical protein
MGRIELSLFPITIPLLISSICFSTPSWGFVALCDHIFFSHGGHEEHRVRRLEMGAFAGFTLLKGKCDRYFSMIKIEESLFITTKSLFILSTCFSTPLWLCGLV